MYIQTRQGYSLGLGEPPEPPKSKQPALRKKFISNVVAYRNAKDERQVTNSSIYVPSGVRDPKQMDLLIFFHGLLHICDEKHGNDADNVIKKFKFETQVDTDPQLALAVPIVMWNSADRSRGFIKSAWSAAYINGYVEEVLDQIEKSSVARPNLGRLILSGHSAAYDILTPLADQFDSDVADTNKGALAKLDRVLALDTTYRQLDALALERWARKRPSVKFDLVLSKWDPSLGVWNSWEKIRKKFTGSADAPTNLRVLRQTVGHCELPPNFMVKKL